MVNTIKVLALEGDSERPEIKELGNGCYEIIKKSGSVIVEVLEIDFLTKSIKIRTGHRVHDLVFKNELDIVLDQLGIKVASDLKSTAVKAPMPGKVIEVLAKEGETVEKGEAILILEAMKMENVLKAENDCVIKKVHVSKEESVDKNQILVEFD